MAGRRQRPAAQDATLSDVAAQAGVSRHTAGFILAGKGGRFRPETVAAVQRAAEILRYRPSGIGQALRSGRTRTIGFIQDRCSHRTAIESRLLAALECALAAAGLQMIFATIDEEADAPQVVARVIAEGFLVNYHAPPPPALAQALAGRAPAIHLNTPLAAASVSHDERDGALRLSRRCRERWGPVAFLERSAAAATDVRAAPHHALADRREGYLADCAAAGVAPHLLRTTFGDGQPALLEQAVALLRRAGRPRGIVVGTGIEDAIILHLAAARCGLRVPEDLALASFGAAVPDDLGWAMPVAVQDWAAMAREAGAMLLAAMAGPGRRPASRHIAMRQE